MDKIVAKIAALGIPGVILLVALSAVPYAGAAAFTTALCALGPGGMLGGIATLGVIGIASDAIAEYGFDAIFTAVIKTLYNKYGYTKESLLQAIDKYPITKSLKRKLKEELDKLD